MAQEEYLVRIEKYPYLKSSKLCMPNSLVKNWVCGLAYGTAMAMLTVLVPTALLQP